MLEKIALKKKLISVEDCRKAVEACKSSKNYEAALKQYFLAHNLIEPQKLEQLISTTDAIRIMQKTIKFGAVAIDLGFIDQQTLDDALKLQKKAASSQQRPKLIGQILLDTGKLAKNQIAAVISEQKNRNKAISKDRQNQSPDENDEHNHAPETKNSSDIPIEFEQKHKIPSTSEKIPGGMILDIEDNGMSAFLRKTSQFSERVSVQEIYSALTSKNIQHGIASISAIEGFIDSSGFRKNRFKIASGTPVVKGQNARIEYYFETDHLTAGGLDKDGNFDFKNRGEVPKVPADKLIAEKFPFIPEKEGRDIFGNIHETEPAFDIRIENGPGVYLSDDEQKAYTLITGYPRLSRSGQLSVEETYELKGDVGYETGHVHYQGKIRIDGCLKSGFNIRGDDIMITEIDGGHIFSKGNVMVINGVNDAIIEARGHVQAKFVHNSKIYSLGDVTINKELVDSTIECSGAFDIATGEIINSDVAANQGVLARNIGTERTDPCTITVGRGEFVNNEIKRLKSNIKQFELQKGTAENKLETATAEYQHLHQNTAQTIIALDKTILDKKRLQDDPAAGEKEKEKSTGAGLKQLIIKLSHLETLLKEHYLLLRMNELKRSDYENTIADLENAIAGMEQEIELLTEFSQINQGKSKVTADGRITGGTMINTTHAQKEIKEMVRHAEISETRVQIQNSESNIHEIQIS